jgi:hypothetical protein
VTGVDPTTEDDLMAILEAECRQGKTVLASTHDLAGVAEHFTRLLSLNRTVVADGPAALVRDAGVLSATYGGHLIEVDHGDMVLLDDPTTGKSHANPPCWISSCSRWRSASCNERWSPRFWWAGSRRSWVLTWSSRGSPSSVTPSLMRATIVLVETAVFGVALALSPRRGVLVGRPAG